MVCRGLVDYEESTGTGSQGGTPHHHQQISEDMAMNARSWGRRKQANPKRNLDEDCLPGHQELGVNSDPSEIDIPTPPSPKTSSDTAIPHQRAKSFPVTDDPDDDDNDKLTIATPNDITTAALPVITMLPEDNLPLENKDDLNSTNIALVPDAKNAGDSEPSIAAITQDATGRDSEPVAMETEDMKIQELMRRSDTAVIFPEPVSDQEEGANTTENEDGLEAEEEEVRCPNCDDTFPSVDLLQEHWHSQHQAVSSKFCCPQCGISFAVKSQLDKHCALHSPSSQVCKMCNKTFANVYRLQRHMISHEESSELRKFKCPECGKAFKFKHHLKEHIRIHSGEKPFECQNCGKRFSHSGSYSSHMTSKKCWIVNMKMRGGAGMNGRGSQTPEKLTGSSRPMVAKGGMDGGLDMSLASMMYNGLLPPQSFIPFDSATANQIQNQYMAQLNSATGPFIPQLPFTAAPMTNAVIPGINNMAAFGCLPPGMLDKEGLMTKSLVNGFLLDKDDGMNVKEVMDENQNKEMVKKLEEFSKKKKVPTATLR